MNRDPVRLLTFQLNTIQRITETWLSALQWRKRFTVSIKHYPTNN